MLREDNNGFINFPFDGKNYIKTDIGKTIIYLVAFDTQDISNKPYILSNNRIVLPGSFVGDDITQRPKPKTNQLTIDELVKQQIKNNDYDKIYFPNVVEDETPLSIPITTSICLGWNENSFELRDTGSPWMANFRDLTHEGKKLYYSIKKLHNNKEVRILTFNNI